MKVARPTSYVPPDIICRKWTIQNRSVMQRNERKKKSFNSFMMNGFVQMIIFNRFFLRFIKGNTVRFFRITKARKITIFLLLAFSSTSSFEAKDEMRFTMKSFEKKNKQF